MFYDIYCELCKSRKISASAAAIEMGINKGTVSVWKTRSTTPNTAQLQKIASYFDVTTDYLLGNEKKPTTDKSDELTFDDFTYALFNQSKELSEENKAKLLEMAKFFKQQQEKE